LKVAVTGITGFVGRHLHDALLTRGYEVRSLVRSQALAGRIEISGKGPCVIGSLSHAPALERLVEGASVVYHVAGAVAAADEAAYHAVNAEATGVLAEAARAAGVARFLYVSSLAAAGPSRRGEAADESVVPRPLTAYGRSKLAGEEAVRRAGLPFTVVRPPAVYGPRDRELLRVFRMARLGVAPLPGDGRQELSLVHVEDLAEALVAAAESPAAEGGTYNAAHPEVLTQRALVGAVAAALRRRVLLVPLPPALVRGLLQATGAVGRATGRATLLNADKAAEFLAPSWACSVEAIERDAGWVARIPLAKGLAGTAAWYRSAGWL
jgi:dihydroflavonol-4-reductase